jgi:hypothetical protein
MGLNDEYSRDAYLPEDVGPDHPEEDDNDPLDWMTQEDWEDWNSEILLDEYMSIREHYESQYLRAPLTFNQFCDKMYHNY